jgi:hypothetical protein
MNENYYNKQQVDRILRRAIESSSLNSDFLSESELFKIADELNIDPSLLRKSINDELTFSEFENAKLIWKSRKKHDYYKHLAAYGIINSFLVAINFITSGTFSWAIFPILGWGIGLAFDTIDSLFPSEQAIEKGARKLMNSKKWRVIFDNIIDSFKR